MIARARFALLLALAGLCAWSIAGMQLAAVALALLALPAMAKVEVRAPVLAFTAICAASVLLSPALGQFSPWAWRFPLLVWIVAAAARELDARELDRVALAWMAAMAGAAAWGIAQAFTGLDLLALLHVRAQQVVVSSVWPGHFAALGFFNSRLTFANALLVPLALAFAWTLRGSGRTRVAAGAMAAVLALALALTFTRAAWWGALLALGIASWVHPSMWERTPVRYALRQGSSRTGVRSHKPIVLVGAAVVAVGLLVPSFRARFASSVSPAANADRIFIWERAREVISDHPVLGVGFGGYARVAEPYYDRADPTFGMHTWAHDTFLSLLAETGPTGLAAYLWLWIAVYVLGARAVRAGSVTALGLVAGTAAVHVASLFHDVLYDGEVAFALYVAAGLLAALGARASEPRSASR